MGRQTGRRKLKCHGGIIHISQGAFCQLWRQADSNASASDTPPTRSSPICGRPPACTCPSGRWPRSWSARPSLRRRTPTVAAFRPHEGPRRRPAEKTAHGERENDDIGRRQSPASGQTSAHACRSRKAESHDGGVWRTCVPKHTPARFGPRARRGCWVLGPVASSGQSCDVPDPDSRTRQPSQQRASGLIPR